MPVEAMAEAITIRPRMPQDAFLHRVAEQELRYGGAVTPSIGPSSRQPPSEGMGGA